MFQLNEEELKSAIVQKAVDELIDRDHSFDAMIRAEVVKRIDKLFADKAEAQVSALVDHLRGQIKELKAAPAVPQGWVEQMLTDARYVFDAGGPETPQETRDVIEYVASWIAAYRDKFSATPAPAPAQDEPYGYFRAEPFGWTDCAKDDEGAIALYERPQEVGLTDDQADAVSMALRRAWQLGQTYWQQADSDYISQHKKSEETQRKFEKLCDSVIAAIRAKGGK